MDDHEYGSSSSRTLLCYAIHFMVAWTLVIAGMYIWYTINHRGSTLEMARFQARNAFERDVTYRFWAAGHGGVYVPPTDATPPNPYLSNHEDRDVTITGGKELTLINPAYMTRQIHEVARQRYGYIDHITSLDPIRPENAPDAWETEALKSFDENLMEVSGLYSINGVEYMRLMRPLHTEESCLPCHADQGYAVGDIHGGISIAIPMTSLWETWWDHTISIGIIIGIIWLLGLAGIAMATRRMGMQASEHSWVFDALRESEEKFSKAFYNHPTPMEIINVATGERVDANESCAELFGMSLEEFQQGNIFANLAWQDAGRQKLGIKRLLKRRSGHNFPMDLMNTSGEVRHVLASGTMLGAKDSDLAIISFVDITERQQAEEQAMRFQRIIDGSLNEIYIFDANTMHFIMVNRGAQENLGYSREELLNLTPLDIKTEFTPESLETLVNPLREGREEKIHFETVHLRKDGTQYPVEVHLQLMEDEEPVFVAIVLDITKRKEVEATLQENDEKFRNLMDQSSMGIEIMTPEGDVVEVNSAARKIWKDTADDAERPEHPVNILNDKQLKEIGVIPLIKKAFLGEFVELPPLRYQGTHVTLWLHARFYPVKNEHGDIISIVLMYDDITERMNAEQELEKNRQHLEEMIEERTSQLNARIAEEEQLNRAMINIMEDLQNSNMKLEITSRELMTINQELDAFSYSVSHDLRAPLRHIAGFVDLLIQDNEDTLNQQGKRYLNIIAESSKRMGELIDDLLAFSRAGRVELHKREFDLNELVLEVVQEYQDETMDGDIDWHVGELPKVFGDRTILRQVVVNLVENAVKYTRKQSQARVEIGMLPGEDSEQVIYVKDNGAGFDMQYVDKLFGVFQRLHNVDEFEGTGVGLANVRRIIHRHGGKTWAEGKENEGATFYFTLPEVQA